MLGIMMQRRRQHRFDRGDRVLLITTAFSAATLALGGLLLRIS